ncbi:MAG: ribosome maturation factor RimP [Candidatus Omnitrophota bacterium]
MEQKQQIQQLIQPILENHNSELVDIILTDSTHNRLLRILVDKEKSSINLEECAAINKEISALLDENDIIKESYTLEVSSPGLDRPLKSKRDFQKVTGEELEFYLKEQIGGKNFYKAILDSVNEQTIIIRTKDGRLVTLPIASISMARLKIKF